MKYKIILFVLFSVALTACIQTKQTYYLNPNGSGKVEFHLAQPLDFMGMTPAGEKYKTLNSEISKILEADGIEAWKDIKIEVLPDSSKFFFTGTAYFPDYTALTSQPFELNVSFTDIGSGKYKFSLLPDDEDDNDDVAENEITPGEDDPYAGMSTKDKLATMRNQFQMSMGMIRGFMSNMEVNQIFVLPGNITSGNGLKQLNEHTVQLLVNGDSLVNALNKIVNDDELMTALLEKNPNAQNFDQVMDSKDAQKLVIGKMLGIDSDDPSVIISSVRPSFDYKKEVAAAAKDFEALKQKYKN